MAFAYESRQDRSKEIFLRWKKNFLKKLIVIYIVVVVAFIVVFNMTVVENIFNNKFGYSKNSLKKDPLAFAATCFGTFHFHKGDIGMRTET